MIYARHKFTSAFADGGDATLLQPSNWNDTHTFCSTYGSTGAFLVRDPASTGGDGASWTTTVQMLWRAERLLLGSATTGVVGGAATTYEIVLPNYASLRAMTTGAVSARLAHMTTGNQVELGDTGSTGLRLVGGGISTGETVAWLTIYSCAIATGLTTLQVLVGTTDSGGAGYRLLRVANNA